MALVVPGRTILLLGPPGSGKSTLARQALEWHGSGLIALAPGLDEFATYRKLHGKEGYIIEGFDDPNFFPTARSTAVEGYDKALQWLRGVYAALKKRVEAGEPLPYKLLVVDTFNQFAGLAMNKTLAHLRVDMPPPAMSPTGAAFWGYQRNLQNQLMTICRSIRGLGLHWVATCHVQEKEMKETAIANPDQIEGMKAKAGIVPAISGGFRDVVAGGFDLVLHCGVTRNAEKQPVYYLRWQSSDKRPSKSRYGSLATADKIAADWPRLKARLAEIDNA